MQYVVLLILSTLSLEIAADPLPVATDSIIANSLANVVLGLLLVLLLFFALTFFMKRIPNMNMSGNGHLKVIETLYLGNHEKILLLQIGEEQILVSVNAQKIEKIHQLPKLLNEAEVAPENNSFNRSFLSAIKQMSGRQAG